MTYEPEKFEKNHRAIENFDWKRLENIFRHQLRRSPYSYSYYEQPHMTVVAFNGKAFGVIGQMDFPDSIRPTAFRKDQYWAHSSVNRGGEGGMGFIYTPRVIRPKFGDSP